MENILFCFQDGWMCLIYTYERTIIFIKLERERNFRYLLYEGCTFYSKLLFM